MTVSLFKIDYTEAYRTLKESVAENNYNKTNLLFFSSLEESCSDYKPKQKIVLKWMLEQFKPRGEKFEKIQYIVNRLLNVLTLSSAPKGRLLKEESFKKNGEKEIQSLRRATKLGEFDSMYKLALIHYKGQGVPKDIQQAINLLKKAANKGHLQSMYRLARIYHKDQCVPHATQRAMQLALEAANKGHPPSMCFLARWYYHNPNLPQGKKRAIQLWEELKKALEALEN